MYLDECLAKIVPTNQTINNLSFHMCVEIPKKPKKPRFKVL
jgi:hypothetical protein